MRYLDETVLLYNILDIAQAYQTVDRQRYWWWRPKTELKESDYWTFIRLKNVQIKAHDALCPRDQSSGNSLLLCLLYKVKKKIIIVCRVCSTAP